MKNLLAVRFADGTISRIFRATAKTIAQDHWKELTKKDQAAKKIDNPSVGERARYLEDGNQIFG